MNRLVIIGNGFDMAHDLKTSYCDFITWYLESFIDKFVNLPEQSGDNGNIFWHQEDALLKLRIQQPRNSFDETMPNPLMSAYNEYRNLPHRNPCDFLKEQSRSYITSLTVKKGLLFNEIFDDITDKGWTDIESSYYKLLKENYKYAEDLNFQMLFLRNQLSYYLKLQSTSQEISKVFENLNADIKENEISESAKILLKEVKDKKYSSSSKYYHFETSTEVETTMLLDFNYTSTTDKYKVKDKIIINHIHGSLDKPDEMIFGYGDEMDKDFKELEDQNNNELLKNSKSVKYLETSHYKDLLNFINGGLFQVFIMGHSCGNSDRTLLNTIFEHENCISIKPFYYINEKGIDNYSELAINIYRNFKDKTLFRDRVVNKEYCTTIKE